MTKILKVDSTYCILGVRGVFPQLFEEQSNKMQPTNPNAVT